ncbi:FAD-binding oxidoreductase [Streptomyces sp. NPDC058595]|uniref:FAD-binding oxidoreductase n=1 Tax=Streptomyces sp. NPDC058595 TaxID=3346550 RepID=UPI00364A297A
MNPASENDGSPEPPRRPSWAGELNALAEAVDGPVLTPGSQGYDAEVAVFNGTVAHDPGVAVGATCVADVVAATRFARAHGLPVAVLNTGHGPSLGASHDTVLISTRRMSDVVIDAERRTARVQAGVRFGQLVEESTAHGLAPLVGSSPGVGVVGFTLGGGISPTMGRTYGWASDHVTAMDVVTADGEEHRVTPDDEPELFGALLGGKSNFGIVTAMEFALFPVTRLYAGALFFSGDDTRAVLEEYRRFTASAPDEMSSGLAFLNLPPLPALPPFLQGKLAVCVRISHVGPASEGERLVAPLRARATPLLDTVGEMPYSEFAAISMDPTEPTTAVEHFGMLDELTQDTVDALLDTVGPGSGSSLNLVDLRHLGGAYGARPATWNAVGTRDAAYALFSLAFVPPGEDVAAYAAPGAELVARLAPWLSRRGHPGLLAPADATEQRTRAAYDPAVYERLRGLKAAYDPDNRLRVNHNIPPLTAS